MPFNCRYLFLPKITLSGFLSIQTNVILQKEVVYVAPELKELNSNLTIKKLAPDDLKFALLKIVNKYSNRFNLTSPLKKFSNLRSAFLDSICHGSLRVVKN